MWLIIEDTDVLQLLKKDKEVRTKERGGTELKWYTKKKQKQKLS